MCGCISVCVSVCMFLCVSVCVCKTQRAVNSEEQMSKKILRIAESDEKLKKENRKKIRRQAMSFNLTFVWGQLDELLNFNNFENLLN